jgi:hypothetical protein
MKTTRGELTSRVSAYLPIELRTRTATYAARMGLSESVVARAAIREYLKHPYPRPSRNSESAAVEAALTKYLKKRQPAPPAEPDQTAAARRRN